MTASFIAERILWVDMEMTGLDAQHDVIVEIACLVTDWDFNELARFESGVAQLDSVVRPLLEANPFFKNLPQSTQDEFYAATQSGEPLEVVEQNLLGFVDDNFPADQPVLLAGNSIHLDRQFIRAYWPTFNDRLHYRMLDVSAWKVVMQGKYGVTVNKKEVHRALDDIRESIDELKFYTQKLS